ncbi:MAG: CvpA family protein [Oscillospiraceae bacterium]|nr:CvpA family protein [Oscillospiraceae bacterium]
MGLIIDAALLGLYALIIYFAAKKGFILVLIDMAAVILATIVSYAVSASVAAKIYDAYLKDVVMSAIRDKLPENLANFSTQQLLDSLPAPIAGLAESLNLIPQDTIDRLNQTISLQNLESTIIAPVCTSILKIICFVAISIITIIVLKIVGRLISGLIKKTPLKKFNTALGLVLGALKGLITLTIISFLLIIIASLFKNGSFAAGVEASKVCSLLSSLKSIF